MIKKMLFQEIKEKIVFMSFSCSCPHGRMCVWVKWVKGIQVKNTCNEQQKKKHVDRWAKTNHTRIHATVKRYD